ncbi:hypothetical protein QN355_09090 [Cryobacterium sp. 10S3]|uniref:hypothetical protein n=1 Tax=unclassified Cryobacterium TaxID=2649013 RepID=UPI002AC8BE4D|nr:MULTISPECIES: hypothetical protein [unclassified Cryobacterium]MEB0001673.1 hypothetical protein [Cryobacterium sp. RTC2.1]MEB0286704.1 hypothetical protein [Cryobacterium sp. 10S3]WPX13175.1 hypothetical protein RHM57_16120 [Cryobacterium sp. 10S3]
MMATDDDKATADITDSGEARHLAIRRPRLDRDGLFLFGRRYGSQSVTLGSAELHALVRDRWIAVDVLGEYILYIHIDWSGR